MNTKIDYLLSPPAIRERSLKLFELARSGKTHFAYHPEKLEAVIDFVVETIRAKYPDLKIPFHSRWGHFKAAGVDRVASVLEPRLKGFPAAERARVKLDLVIVSVLLDAGAGEQWKFREESTGQSIARSEGLGVASFWMFMNGLFSHDPEAPLQANAMGLRHIRREKLAQAFQISNTNPLTGLDGRLELLHQLGAAVDASPELFPYGRPGSLFDAIQRLGHEVPAVRLLRAVLDGLGPIWPGRIALQGVNLGDCWRHKLLGPMQDDASLIPFHKLSQWMTYSLIEPIEEAGVKITGVHEMTGLPEYRNGGLLLDRGLISLRQPSEALDTHAPGSELIVEWRALTVTCLDLIATGVRARLGKTEAEFPLAQVLEGGTWWAGRIAAKEKRPDGSPPLKLESDGTVF